MCGVSPVPPTMYWPYVNDDDGNIYREILGAYRGNQQAFHASHPVIFEHISSAPNVLAHGASGSVTANKGAMGTLSSFSHLHGTTRLIVYGDPQTGKPSSWTLLEWKGTGKNFPETNTERYQWQKVPNAKAVLSKSGFYEAMKAFTTSRTED